MKTLEENVEQSLLREESMLNEANGMGSDLPADVAELHQTIRELKLKYEVNWKGFFVPIVFQMIICALRLSWSNCVNG